jgi:metal-responsive CopG/Arc/MetJ family transcriptional regulator
MADKRIYTEIRIPHKTDGEKLIYEIELDQALRRIGFNNRAEWLRQMIRDAIYQAKRLDTQTEHINAKIKVDIEGEGK